MAWIWPKRTHSSILKNGWNLLESSSLCGFWPLPWDGERLYSASSYSQPLQPQIPIPWCGCELQLVCPASQEALARRHCRDWQWSNITCCQKHSQNPEYFSEGSFVHKCFAKLLSEEVFWGKGPPCITTVIKPELGPKNINSEYCLSATVFLIK